MIKKCPKCGFENHHKEDLTKFSECPICGIIYSKYEKMENQSQKERENLHMSYTLASKAKNFSMSRIIKKAIFPLIALSIIIISISGHKIMKTTGYFGPSKEDISTATIACENFIQEEFGPYTNIFDTWEKDGKIVVEIGYNDSPFETKYSVRLCVVDLEKGRISVPSVFNMNEWKK